jgi:hypothetical protein
LYTILHGLGSLELRLARLFDELTERGNLGSPHVNAGDATVGAIDYFPVPPPDSESRDKVEDKSNDKGPDVLLVIPTQSEPGGGRKAFVPRDWSDIALPLALLMREFANKIIGASASPDFQQAFVLLHTAVTTWQARDAAAGRSANSADATASVLKAVGVRVDTSNGKLALADAAAKAKEAEQSKRKILGRLWTSNGGALGPGGLESPNPVCLRHGSSTIADIAQGRRARHRGMVPGS